MPSIFHDKSGPIASFRAVGAPGRVKRRVRVPADRRDDPEGFAAECDSYCRLLEKARMPAAGVITEAERLGAITASQAAALRLQRGGDMTTIPSQSLTILQAARSHPSSQKEAAKDVSAALRHERHLGEFMAWAKVQRLDQVTLSLAQSWVAELRARNLSWDGRRHALLWLRRATRMGATVGMADQLNELLRDERDQDQRGPEAWTLTELTTGFRALENDPRARAALALGGFLGLRPSETIRVRVGDLAEGRLMVGQADRKNAASRRLLPLPRIVAEAVSRLALGRSPSEPLIRSLKTRGRAGGAFDAVGFNHWLGPVLEAATGRRLPPKALRKSFTSWAFRAGLPPQHVEAMLGHKTALASAVTGRHYLAELACAELQPTALRIEEIIRKALAGPQRGATSS
jgi:integrase